MGTISLPLKKKQPESTIFSQLDSQASNDENESQTEDIQEIQDKDDIVEINQ